MQLLDNFDKEFFVELEVKGWNESAALRIKLKK